MEKWLKTRGMMLAGYFIIMGMVVIALINYAWLVHWWICLLLTVSGILAVLLIWRGMNNAGWIAKPAPGWVARLKGTKLTG